LKANEGWIEIGLMSARRHLKFDGRWRDDERRAILREDWLRQRRSP
jgi:RimJ/RimL family protein N-acetyltransferase